MCCTSCLEVSSLRSSLAGLVLTQIPTQMSLRKGLSWSILTLPPPTIAPSPPALLHPLIRPGLSPNYHAVLCFPEDPSQYKVTLLTHLLTVFYILFLHSKLLKFSGLNNNRSIMLVNSVSQEFGENTVG